MNQIQRAVSKSQIRRILKDNPGILEEAYRVQRDYDIDMMSHIILCLSMMVLEDVFGFGKVRLKRFAENYKEKLINMEDGLFTFDDALEYFSDLGIDIRKKRR